jgi:hypothetical protein
MFLVRTQPRDSLACATLVAPSVGRAVSSAYKGESRISCHWGQGLSNRITVTGTQTSLYVTGVGMESGRKMNFLYFGPVGYLFKITYESMLKFKTLSNRFVEVQLHVESIFFRTGS